MFLLCKASRRSFINCGQILHKHHINKTINKNGDRCAAGHIRQHAGRFALPAGGSVSLCGCEQPQKIGVRPGDTREDEKDVHRDQRMEGAACTFAFCMRMM
ncbi:hypothetical protein Q8A67_013164 [Cirrhinus molitorella]|uniref:Uncharacterized protein n=1 Tax=Cirrhinus molitorella TaxID=172907 RepID=A0AA88TM08_9TELE|nr:hypothetical protein Q8A67_013164 [Cirrhinus molitorella]